MSTFLALAYYWTGFTDDRSILLDVCESPELADEVIRQHQAQRDQTRERAPLWWVETRPVRTASALSSSKTGFGLKVKGKTEPWWVMYPTRQDAEYRRQHDQNYRPDQLEIGKMTWTWECLETNDIAPADTGDGADDGHLPPASRRHGGGSHPPNGAGEAETGSAVSRRQTAEDRRDRRRGPAVHDSHPRR